MDIKDFFANKETLLKKLLKVHKRLHDYVILKKDVEGYYIEYAFCDGAPHDNRCLSWYYSFQPTARKRNKWDEEALAQHEKELDKNVGKIYSLSSFTCGGEEYPTAQLERGRKKFEETHPGEVFIPEDHVCRVGRPMPRCRECLCPHWTYKEPVKCACWNLNEVDIDDITFSFTAESLKKFISEYIQEQIN